MLLYFLMHSFFNIFLSMLGSCQSEPNTCMFLTSPNELFQVTIYEKKNSLKKCPVLVASFSAISFIFLSFV